MIDSLFHSFIHAFIHSYLHPFIHSLSHPFIRLFFCPLIHSAYHTSYIICYFHSYIHTIKHSFIYTFIHLIRCSCTPSNRPQEMILLNSFSWNLLPARFGSTEGPTLPGKLFSFLFRFQWGGEHTYLAISNLTKKSRQANCLPPPPPVKILNTYNIILIFFMFVKLDLSLLCLWLVMFWV